jgi:hypothetical protein
MNRAILDRERRSVPVFAALAAVILLLLPAPARAQSASGGEMVYSVSGLCVFGSAQVTTAWPNGEVGLPLFFTAASTVSAYSSCPNAVVARQYAPCTWPYNTGCPIPPVKTQPWVAKTMPAGTLAILQQLYLVVNGQAQYCSTPLSTWQYSSTAEAAMTVSSVSTAMCGQGYYELGTGVYAWNGSAWEGGWYWVGSLYMDMM